MHSPRLAILRQVYLPNIHDESCRLPRRDARRIARDELRRNISHRSRNSRLIALLQEIRRNDPVFLKIARRQPLTGKGQKSSSVLFHEFDVNHCETLL